MLIVNGSDYYLVSWRAIPTQGYGAGRSQLLHNIDAILAEQPSATRAPGSKAYAEILISRYVRPDQLEALVR